MKTILKVAILMMVVFVVNGQTPESSNQTQTTTNETDQYNKAKVANLKLFPEDKVSKRREYWDSYDGINIFFGKGKVGIGLDRPETTLHVMGATRIAGDIELLDAHRFIGTITNHNLYLRTNNSNQITILSSGHVGIGTSSPKQKLHVNGSTRIEGNVELRNGHRFMGTITNHSLYLRTNNTNQLTILGNGNVGIGISPISNAKLTVNGKILATEVEVVSQIQSDFVFEADYELMTLSDVKNFIGANKHLPGIPSMHEFAENGQNLAEVQDLLLRKIEELTLYILEQEERIKELENSVTKQ